MILLEWIGVAWRDGVMRCDSMSRDVPRRAHLTTLTRDLVIVLEDDREVFERSLRTFPGVITAFAGYAFAFPWWCRPIGHMQFPCAPPHWPSTLWWARPVDICNSLVGATICVLLPQVR